MENGNLLYPAGGALTVSTAWTSTSPFKGQSTNIKYAVSRGVYVGGAGTLGLIMYDGSTGLFPNVSPGQIYPLRAIALSSRNTATSLVAVF